MRISAICMQCQIDDGEPPLTRFSVEFPERGWFELTCDRGHRTATVIQATKFEIFSKRAVDAIADCSYGDAVLSLALSLERLYEFFIEATCRQRGVSREQFTATWASMSNQSERQLGAFLAAFLIVTGETPKLLPRKAVELRNSVVHKGKFPAREESIKFGEAVFDCAHSVLDILRGANFDEIRRTLVFEHVGERMNEAVQAGIPIPGVIWIGTPLSISIEDQPKDFSAHVPSYADFRSNWEGI